MTTKKTTRQLKNATRSRIPHNSKITLPDEHPPARTVLRFTPWAWAKLHFFCHHGDTEIGGFGITPPDDLLLIKDFVTVEQKTSCISVAFDDEAVADFFESQVDAGSKPEQFARHWCHTHPGDSPCPSITDEETFSRVFGSCDWAVMFILAKGGETYARLRFNIGPKGEMQIPVEVDYSAAFEASAQEAWKQEYDANIHPEPLAGRTLVPTEFGATDWYDEWSKELDPTIEAELLSQFEEMEFDEHTLEDEVIL